ncbi:MAG: 50S ribosomal protein L4 [Clostridia bacterium]|nr:50S ribosomal protein L4 [Clostridia bacterium]MBQ7317162.1 50S ribosomal protein L4 [Clostridia bacterium]
MPNVKVFNMAGEAVGTMVLSDMIFGAEINAAVLHAAVRAYLLNQRQGTQSTLTRTEVSGGGRKPWRQKGTGRARQGSTRSPQWTHGGIALGPKPRSYHTGMNKKTKRVALFSALSAKVAEGKLIIVDEIKCAEYKTKTMVNMLKALGAENRTLVVLPEVNPYTIKSCANIERVETCLFSTINVYEILKADKLVITAAAVKMLEEVYA